MKVQQIETLLRAAQNLLPTGNELIINNLLIMVIDALKQYPMLDTKAEGKKYNCFLTVVPELLSNENYLRHIFIIKAIKKVMNLSLKEAKDFTDKFRNREYRVGDDLLILYQVNAEQALAWMRNDDFPFETNLYVVEIKD